MSEINIFKEYDKFEQRGNPGVEVDWHLFENRKEGSCVCYVTVQGWTGWVHKDGKHYGPRGSEGSYDLVPMLPPPVTVPWDCPDDVPDPCWIRLKPSMNLDVQPVLVVGFSSEGVPLLVVEDEDEFEVVEFHYKNLFDHYDWSSDRKAKDGWQVCGKLQNAQK